MLDDFLTVARRQAQEADPSVRAAALLRIARVESTQDASRASQTLRQGLEQIRQLAEPNRGYLLEEARLVAAAVAPESLMEITPPLQSGRRELFIEYRIVQIMLEHRHIDAAFKYLLHYDDPESFPFLSVGNVLHHLASNALDNAARRLSVIRRAVDMWRWIPATDNNHHRDEFVGVFGHFWKELPTNEALTVAHEFVRRALEEPDADISAGYMDEIHFSSRRQHLLFEILHILRHLDPERAESLVNSHEQLAIAAQRFPRGVETMREEADAEAERRKKAGASCETGYIFMGDPDELDEQLSLFQARNRGEFGPAIENALERYRQESSPSSFNYAPKEYWSSTGRLRTVFHQAGKRIGPAAAALLDRIPDPDLRLFATIELAAGLAHAPEPSVTERSQPNSPETLRQRRLSARSSSRQDQSGSKPMRADDGRFIRCPECLFRPTDDLCWGCKCGHIWNTFSTSGRCPACQFQWEVTQCPDCGEVSPHQAWYVSDAESSERE